MSGLSLSDDRFILKQMPRLEVQSFLDFAPHYFTYITGAVQQKVRRICRVPSTEGGLEEDQRAAL